MRFVRLPACGACKASNSTGDSPVTTTLESGYFHANDYKRTNGYLALTSVCAPSNNRRDNVL